MKSGGKTRKQGKGSAGGDELSWGASHDGWFNLIK